MLWPKFSIKFQIDNIRSLAKFKVDQTTGCHGNDDFG